LARSAYSDMFVYAIKWWWWWRRRRADHTAVRSAKTVRHYYQSLPWLPASGQCLQSRTHSSESPSFHA